MQTKALSPELLATMDAYWRAANYLSVGQIYLYQNPLLREPLALSHVKPRLLGHWGTTPGLNFIYVHLNRAINQYDLDVLYIAGPGHGGPAVVAKNVQQMNIKVPLYQSHGVASPKIIELAGESAEGTLLPTGKILVHDLLPVEQARGLELADRGENRREGVGLLGELGHGNGEAGGGGQRRRSEAGDGAHGQFRLPGDAELAYDEDVERRAEPAGHFRRDGHAPARQADDDRLRACVIEQRIG